MFNHVPKVRKWSLVILAGVIGTFTAPRIAYAQGTWTTNAAVPTAADGMTVGGVGQVIVAAYGASASGATNQTQLYNISSNTWSVGAVAPGSARSDAAYGDTTHGGFLYVIGGDSGTAVLSDVEQYDPVLNTWVTLSPMPTARAGAVAAAIDDDIFVIGGRSSTGGPCSGGPYLGTVERYDIPTNTWSTMAPLPNARSDMAAVAKGGKIFVFGGCTGTTASPILSQEVDMYDPNTNTWTTTLALMPTPRASLVGGRKGNLIYAIGGTNGTTTLNVNEVYDISANTWTTNTATMTTARQQAGVHSHGATIYVVGGSTTTSGSSTAAGANESFQP